jgi:ABC-type multidrug transport system fused ATPase/permease subunit
VSLQRIAVFLGCSEVNETGYIRNIDANGEVIVENATLYWYDPDEPIPLSVLDASSPSGASNRSSITTRVMSFRGNSTTSLSSQKDTSEDEEKMAYPKPVLRNIDIHVRTGELCAIVGPVGSGKSTLCSAVLNEW